MTSVMAANILNFVFNAFVGRTISFVDFGVLTLINTFLYFGGIFYNALLLTINHHIAYLEGRGYRGKSKQFFSFVTKRVLVISLGIGFIWFICVPFIARFFHISNVTILYFFTPVLLLYPLAAIGKGYLQGKLFFTLSAVIILIEPLLRLLLGMGFLFVKQPDLVYLSLYISPVLTGIIALFISIRYIPASSETTQVTSHFPSKFFISATITGLSTISFLALDVVLVKHYLNATVAGEYALLSLIGKIVYFLGSILNIFIISLVSRDLGANKNSRVSFYWLFLGSVLLCLLSYFVFGLLGSIFIPLLFGQKALLIVPYASQYVLSIALFTLANTIVTYHLVRKQYYFSIIALILSLLMIGGISIYHATLKQIVTSLLIVSSINGAILLLLHLKQSLFSSRVSLETLQVLEENR